LKTAMGPSLGEDDVSLGIIIFSMIFNNMYRMTRYIISSWVIQIGNKCNNLSNFPAVTLWAPCQS
jgi:hypothetical protein